ncbi:MAG TPA: flavin reductase family protein [Stenomitos sp.]
MSTSIFNLTNPEIYIITAAHAGLTSGQVATWVTLAALIPEHLRVIAAISPYNYTFDLIQQSQRFAVHLLAEGQEAWVPLFGLCSTRETDKFEGIAATYTATGIPLLPNTCGWAECQISHSIDLGDRTVFIADVVAQDLYPNRKPLRRIEALAALPPQVTQDLAAKRILDIERDRVLRGL